MAKKKPTITAEMWENWARTMRTLEERIAYHAQKIAEEDRRGQAQP